MSEDNSKSKKRLFIDMDGTLARFHDDILDAEGHVQLEKMYEPDFFKNLKPFRNVVEGIQLIIEKFSDKVEFYIISSATLGNPPGFVEQKNAWLDKFLPEIDAEHRLYPEIGTNKTKIIPGELTINDYLLDDYNKNLKEFEKACGQSIKLVNNINHMGLGRYGGSAGALWGGPIVNYADEAKKIAKDLERHLGLVPLILQKENVRDVEPEYKELKEEIDAFDRMIEDARRRATSSSIVESKIKKKVKIF